MDTLPKLPKQITLTYTLSVPLTYPEFIEFANKGREEGNELSVDSETSKELWIAFVEMMKGKKKKLVSGRPVNINQEPDHEVTFILADLIDEFLNEQESDDEEDEVDAQ